MRLLKNFHAASGSLLYLLPSVPLAHPASPTSFNPLTAPLGLTWRSHLVPMPTLLHPRLPSFHLHLPRLPTLIQLPLTPSPFTYSPFHTPSSIHLPSALTTPGPSPSPLPTNLKLVIFPHRTDRKGDIVDRPRVGLDALSTDSVQGNKTARYQCRDHFLPVPNLYRACTGRLQPRL